MASESAVLYIGMTNNLQRRTQEHKAGKYEGFSKKYKCTKLVYFEVTRYVYDTITREKQLKHFLRKEKVGLIESINPKWRDLYEDIF